MFKYFIVFIISIQIVDFIVRVSTAMTNNIISASRKKKLNYGFSTFIDAFFSSFFRIIAFYLFSFMNIVMPANIFLTGLIVAGIYIVGVIMAALVQAIILGAGLHALKSKMRNKVDDINIPVEVGDKDGKR